MIAWLEIATEFPFWGIDMPLVRMHASPQSTAFDARKNAIGMRSIYQFLAEDARFARYPDALRSLAADVESIERRAAGSVSKEAEKGATMKGLLKGIVMWVPPVGRYVERHRAIFRESVALKQEHARLASERAGVLESLIGQVGALNAAVERLSTEFAEPVRIGMEQTSTELARLEAGLASVGTAMSKQVAGLSGNLEVVSARATADVAAAKGDFARALETLSGRIDRLVEQTVASKAELSQRFDPLSEQIAASKAELSQKFDPLSEQIAASRAGLSDQVAASRADLVDRIEGLMRDSAAAHLKEELWYRDLLAVLRQPEVLGRAPAFVIATDNPVAADSDDHLVPWGTQLDNTRWPRFVRACEALVGRGPLRMMDLGCAGGGLVLDFLLAGHSAVGIEGSDFSVVRQRAEWRTIPFNLFTADITKPFTISPAGQEGNRLLRRRHRVGRDGAHSELRP